MAGNRVLVLALMMALVASPCFALFGKGDAKKDGKGDEKQDFYWYNSATV